jgi:hypothetical protein
MHMHMHMHMHMPHAHAMGCVATWQAVQKHSASPDPNPSSSPMT